MEMPRVCSTTRKPIARTSTRVMFTKIVAEPATPEREVVTVRTSPATSRAAATVTTKISSTVSTWLTVCWTALVSGSAAPAIARPPAIAAEGTTVRSAATMTSSPPHLVRSACLPSHLSSMRSRKAATRPATTATPAPIMSSMVRSR
ncbi:hypothetical protein RKD46_001429 [Streptomyces pseudovenezuelae]